MLDRVDSQAKVGLPRVVAAMNVRAELQLPTATRIPTEIGGVELHSGIRDTCVSCECGAFLFDLREPSLFFFRFIYIR